MSRSGTQRPERRELLEHRTIPSRTATSDGGGGRGHKARGHRAPVHRAQPLWYWDQTTEVPSTSSSDALGPQRRPSEQLRRHWHGRGRCTHSSAPAWLPLQLSTATPASGPPSQVRKYHSELTFKPAEDSTKARRLLLVFESRTRVVHRLGRSAAPTPCSSDAYRSGALIRRRLSACRRPYGTP